MAELKELRLKNFKSFRKAIIPFKGGFTVVIGPNGSGKSNILDAILFVFGSTSMKSLRAGRISGLINNTTKESYGRVEVAIKDKGRLWRVSRTIDRKGKSTCRIDEQKKSLSEVVSLLNELGLKSDGDNIVAQGDITRIIEMSPEQRRQIIDGLAGIKEFDLKREEAGKNLAKAEERVKGANLILGERLSRVKELEEEKRAAEEYLRLTSLKGRAKAAILGLEAEGARRKMHENQIKLKNIKIEADTVNRKIAELRGKASETEKAQREKERELFERQEESFRKILSRIEALKGEKNLLMERQRSEKRRLAENSEREAVLSKQLAELKEESEAEKARLEEIAAEKPSLKKELKETEEELGALDSRSRGKEGMVERLESELKGFEAEIEKKQHRLLELLQEKTAVEKQNSLAEAEIIEIDKRTRGLKPLGERAAKAKERLALLEAKKPAELAESVDRNIENAVAEQKSFQARAGEIQGSLKELKKEIAQCPVCGSELPAQKKKKLIEKKEGEEREALFGAKRASKELASLRKRAGELKEEQTLLLELRGETSVIAEKLSALKELEDRRNALSSGIKSTSKEAAEIGTLEKDLQLLKSERGKASERISSIKTDRIAIELNARKSELGNRLKALAVEETNISEKVLARIESSRESAIAEIDRIHSGASEAEKRLESLERDAEDADKELAGLDKKNEEQRKALDADRERKEALERKLTALREKKDSLESDSKKKAREMEELRVENGKYEVRLSDLEEEFTQFRGVKPLKNLSLKELGKEFSEAEKKLEGIGAVNLKAAESLSGERVELLEVKEKLEKIEEERNAILEMIEKIEIKRKDVFMECFNQIRDNFARMFYNFFDGSGNLGLTDEEKPTESGLLIEAKHKGESLQNIDSMSGGEKTLTALAFIFAIQQYDPAPFYFFDEADAALDEENSLRLTRVITEISRHSQFIAITHNNSLIKSADQIIGVTVGREKSSVIGLNLKEKIAEKNSS